MIKTKKMKQFSDLKFKDHANVQDGVQARLKVGDFEVSVVSMKTASGTGFGGLYGDASNGTYEVAVFGDNGTMLPLTPYDDVKGWQSVDDLNDLLKDLQSDEVDAFVQGLTDKKDEHLKEMDLA
tara:strand:- start:313 stop:684 length:372 start_codon:yes stop_codon:yes gene_type:complete